MENTHLIITVELSYHPTHEDDVLSVGEHLSILSQVLKDNMSKWSPEIIRWRELTEHGR